MADPVPSFADQAKQLLAEFQHAMDNAAPISVEMMGELKVVLDAGVAAHIDCARLSDDLIAERTNFTGVERKAAALQAEAIDLVATIHGGK